jgi:hypothetical protein
MLRLLGQEERTFSASATITDYTLFLTHPSNMCAKSIASKDEQRELCCRGTDDKREAVKIYL